MPKLSIIVPVYNTNISHLIDSVASILIAAPSDSELHIGFDGPYPETGMEILEGISSKFKRSILRLSQFGRGGLASTLNKLVEQSDCSYLARHDGDDVCLPNRLTLQEQALDLRPTYAFCGTQITRCNEWLQPYRRQRIFPATFSSQLAYASLFNNPIAHPSLMVRRHTLNNAPYNEVPGAEDWDLYIRLWQAGYRSFNLAQTGLLYRVHPLQVTAQVRSTQLLRELKLRSLQAANRHHQSIHLLKPIQQIGNTFRLTELAIHAKSWLDR